MLQTLLHTYLAVCPFLSSLPLSHFAPMTVTSKPVLAEQLYAASHFNK